VRNAFDNFIQFPTYFNKLFDFVNETTTKTTRSSRGGVRALGGAETGELGDWELRTSFQSRFVTADKKQSHVCTVWGESGNISGSCTRRTTNKQAGIAHNRLILESLRYTQKDIKREGGQAWQTGWRPCHRIRCNIKVI